MVVGIAEPCPLRREALWRALRALGCPDLRVLPLPPAGNGLGLAVLAYPEAAGDVLRRAVWGQWAMPPAARSAGAAWWAEWGARWEGLSRRQRAIAWGIARGWSDPEIAQALSIRRSTPGTHLRRLFARLGLPGRQALRAWLRAGGLEDPAIAAGLCGETPWPPGAEDPDFRAVSPFWGDTLRICPPFWRTTAHAGWIE